MTRSGFSYWYARAQISHGHLSVNEIKRRISKQDFYDQTGTENEADWMQSEQGITLIEEMKARILEERLCVTQAQRLKLEKGNTLKVGRRAFMKLFTTSTIGLGIKNTGAGARSSGDQTSFRRALFDIANQGPEPASEAVWCPIAGSEWHKDTMTAAHLFAWKHGQEMMTSIFGEMNPPELFSPYNGLLISTTAEKMLDEGRIVIVPRLPDRPSKSEVDNWQRCKIKQYQIRVLETTGIMQTAIFGRGDKRKWFELDKQPVSFRSDFRPRARYLYFLYCTTMLRRSWRSGEQKIALANELGKPYWGTRENFMKKGMLLAFVEEMGHEYEDLLEGAREERKKAVQPDDLALFAANKQILFSVEKHEECENSGNEGEDDEDWEDSEDEDQDDD
jgi:hypothetical protein